MKYYTLLFFFSFFFGSNSIAQSKINYKYYFDFVNKEAAFDSLNLLYPTLQLTEIGELEFLSNFGKMAFYAN